MEKIPFGKFGFIHKSASDWMRENVTTFASIGVVMIAALAWGVYQWNLGSPKDYLTAEVAFNEWKGDKSEHLVKLQKLLKHHPELHAKYDGRIAQKLLLSSEQGLAASFSKATQKRLGAVSPYYTRFSNCSLLIGENQLEKALLDSKELKVSLDQDTHFWETKSSLVKHGGVLYGYNLLRIAFLEHVAGTPRGELDAWIDFKENAGWLEKAPPSHRYDPEAYELIAQNFQKNDVSLRDFIHYREAVLKNLP